MSPSPSSAALPTSFKRKRVLQACLPCKQRKRKCDGKLPCSSCDGMGYLCEFEEDSRKVMGSGTASKTEVAHASPVPLAKSSSTLADAMQIGLTTDEIEPKSETDDEDEAHHKVISYSGEDSSVGFPARLGAELRSSDRGEEGRSSSRHLAGPISKSSNASSSISPRDDLSGAPSDSFLGLKSQSRPATSHLTPSRAAVASFGWNLGLRPQLSRSSSSQEPTLRDIVPTLEGYFALARVYFAAVWPDYAILDFEPFVKDVLALYASRTSHTASDGHQVKRRRLQGSQLGQSISGDSSAPQSAGNAQSGSPPSPLIEPREYSEGFEAAAASVAALGSIFSGEQSEAAARLEARLVKRAQSLLDENSAWRSPQVEHVAAWLNLGFYARASDHPQVAWRRSSQAVHVAEALGLHLQPLEGEEADVEAEHSVQDQAGRQEPDELCAAIGISVTPKRPPSTRLQRLFWTAKSFNSIVSWEVGLTPVALRQITRLPLEPSAHDATHAFCTLVAILDEDVRGDGTGTGLGGGKGVPGPTRVSDDSSAASIINGEGVLLRAIARIEAVPEPSAVLALVKADIVCSLFRRYRATGRALSKTHEATILDLGLGAVIAAEGIADAKAPWWQLTNTLVQLSCMLIAIDSPTSLAHLGRTLKALHKVQSVFDTQTTREASHITHRIARLLVDKKQRDLDLLTRAVEAQSTILSESGDTALFESRPALRTTAAIASRSRASAAAARDAESNGAGLSLVPLEAAAGLRNPAKSIDATAIGTSDRFAASHDDLLHARSATHPIAGITSSNGAQSSSAHASSNLHHHQQHQRASSNHIQIPHHMQHLRAVDHHHHLIHHDAMTYRGSAQGQYHLVSPISPHHPQAHLQVPLPHSPIAPFSSHPQQHPLMHHQHQYNGAWQNESMGIDSIDRWLEMMGGAGADLASFMSQPQ
ncbi:PROTEIN RDR1 [Ceraceosorus bombacis]|uniref:PROTEIN RDR1 n=1 Tax=Ceraceosorus bombacis TaxID=401625 RepID=A0A0P1BNK0_9BASI|nr:PROTEIN RDR1 [Ceraceosorus bombacis]